MCFHKNINGNRDVKSLECDYLLVQRCVKLTLPIPSIPDYNLSNRKYLQVELVFTKVLIRAAKRGKTAKTAVLHEF